MKSGDWKYFCNLVCAYRDTDTYLRQKQ